MLKSIPTLLLLLLAIGGVLSKSSTDGTDAEISVLPFNPIGFTNFILYLISLPFRIIGMVFGSIFGGGMGGSMMGTSSGTEVDANPFREIMDLPIAILKAVARFIEEIFYFVRLLLDTIFGHLEEGAAYVAGDGPKSKRFRERRNNPATLAEAGIK